VNRTGESRVEATPIKYKKALAWLYSLQRFGIKLGLENIRRLIAELDVDLGRPPVIHVAGTNGKGSVCAMIDSICRAGRYRSGLFTSPHLVTFRERIRVNGEMISESEVAESLTNIRSLVAGWDPHPTFFEITTALGLRHFADSNIDIAILETGLGGRLDATNAVQSDVAVITPIALDHEKWLGDSIEKIAGEKAGIIKANVPVVSAAQAADAGEVIRARAAECDAQLAFVDQPYTTSQVALRGEYQKFNAAIAVAAIRAAKIDISDAAMARGLAAIEWPARFQCWDKRTVIDGAHNPAAAHTLVETWREVFRNERATLILAILADKDLRQICETLAPIANMILLPKIRSERAADPEQIARVLEQIRVVGQPLRLPAGEAPASQLQITASFADALNLARPKPNPILITGSLHFAGEALAHLQGKPAAFEECNQ
jgi:dihydrofolate synthase / folylpolyglutamate synthase